jgi:hypothetical protein
MSQSTTDSIRQIMPIFSQKLSRTSLGALIAGLPGIRLYWRNLTPMVVLWGFICQRLNEDHTCDNYVDYLLSGGADDLDPEDPHTAPLSERLKSESTSAYVQGRNRLPLQVIEEARGTVQAETERWLGEAGQWKGHLLRLIDGTTLRMRPEGDLPEKYGQPKNQYGYSYWVIARALAVFDLISQQAVSLVVAPCASAESHLVWDLLKQEAVQGCIYIGDSLFGIYSVLQALMATKQEAIVRLTKTRARALAKRAGIRPLRPGDDCLIEWYPTDDDKTWDHLSTTPILGRLIYHRLTKPGFRPLDIYLFTTLLDQEQYLLADICSLYQQRWRVEVDFRHVKTTMHMETFKVRSAAMFRKELEAGLLAYNLVCAFMVRAAHSNQIKPIALSFSKCLRRIRRFLLVGGPRHLSPTESADYLLSRLANCVLPIQPNKFPHEPRAIRKVPQAYPYLKGNRDIARQAVIEKFAIS